LSTQFVIFQDIDSLS